MEIPLPDAMVPYFCLLDSALHDDSQETSQGSARSAHFQGTDSTADVPKTIPTY